MLVDAWQEATAIFTDPGHALAEGMFAAVEAGLMFLVGRVLVRRHDRRVHRHDV